MSYSKFCDRVYKFAKRINAEFSLRRIRFSGEGTANYRAVFPTGEIISGNPTSDKLSVIRGSAAVG